MTRFTVAKRTWIMLLAAWALALICLSSSLQAEALSTELPDLTKSPSIFLSLDAAKPDIVKINGVGYTREDAGRWLAGCAEKFGRDDPVLVVAPRDLPLGAAAEIVQMARRTHDHVYGVIKGYTLDEPVLFFTSAHLDHPEALIRFLLEQEPQTHGPFNQRGDINLPTIPVQLPH